MARSFSNAKRLSSFFGDQLSVVISKRGLAAAPQGGALGGGATVMNKVGEESLKPTSTVPEFRSNQVHSLLNHIHPFSLHANLYKAQIPSMLSFTSSFSTSATPSVSHARPLSPHLSIYKPQSNSMFSISNRIAAVALSGIALLFYVLCMKTGLICFTFHSFYQVLFGVAGFTGLICYSSIPLIILHILHAVKH
ncbi:succinate dehydrogenase/Fumarate reductase, transmembrane subunit (mitochondrion) [Artemisia annua]|uniref:Succinate dehydrogenase/Fumarate reductase, transmembrane subunit n=1 Tax=Artemisia annua TaxID=35608 RepID=A0A2U1QA12_ARTAN|nr:succinate dehydrogenase/Fumarate reductase, transmembrane subunit [Artemisia annua]